MKKSLEISTLRFKKLKELLTASLVVWSFNKKSGKLRHGRNLFLYVFKPKFTDLLEFCLDTLPSKYKVKDQTTDLIIDESYSKFILGEYSLSTMGSDYKFNTVRNVFRLGFLEKEYYLNHYSNKISLPTLILLKKEFKDKDIYNLFVPIRMKIQERLLNIDARVYDFVTREFNLLRASPNRIREPISFVA